MDVERRVDSRKVEEMYALKMLAGVYKKEKTIRCCVQREDPMIVLEEAWLQCDSAIKCMLHTR